ncbi:MAG: LptA/OstA family protein, partial [Acidiferrobacteraceae bacterium]
MSDRTQPVNINADRIRINQRTGMTAYYGHVTVQQGTLRIEADRVTASTLARGVRQIDAYGAPVRFREQPRRGAPVIHGSA